MGKDIIPSASQIFEDICNEYKKKPILIATDNEEIAEEYKKQTEEILTSRLISFAKLHVKAALEAAKAAMLTEFRDTSTDEDEKNAYEDDCYVFSEAITNAYPLDLIK